MRYASQYNEKDHKQGKYLHILGWPPDSMFEDEDNQLNIL
jgi:hypothetical protein